MDEASIYEELLEQGYTEEQIQQIMELAMLNPEYAAIEREQGYVDALRQTAAPDGRSVGAGGRVYVASTPFENLGALTRRGLGQYQQKGLDQRSRDAEAEAVRKRIEWLRGGRGGIPTATPPIVPETPGTPAQIFGLGKW